MWLSNEIKKRTSGITDEFNIWQVQTSRNVYPHVDFSICFELRQLVRDSRIASRVIENLLRNT